MIKGIIFDVDGVLLNSMPVWENLGELYLNHLGIEAEKGLGEILYTMTLEEAADYMITHYHLDLSTEQVTAGINQEVRDFYASRVPLKEGVRQYLNEFRERKIPMVIATTGDRDNARAALKRLKILSYFQGIFTCSEIERIASLFSGLGIWLGNLPSGSKNWLPSVSAPRGFNTLST